MKKGIIISVVLMTALCLTTACFAEGPATKVGRGLANILTGWVEIPKNIYDTSVEDNIFSGLTIGLAKGVGMAIVRTGAGVYETITFPFPIPEDYAPVLEPEYVFSAK
ncbi:MAG: exosortase system-associated protein, TIGR04073 family [Candidatus Omnitrophota bacterium]